VALRVAAYVFDKNSSMHRRTLVKPCPLAYNKGRLPRCDRMKSVAACFAESATMTKISPFSAIAFNSLPPTWSAEHSTTADGNVFSKITFACLLTASVNV
jgi:hypothetical protein